MTEKHDFEWQPTTKFEISGKQEISFLGAKDNKGNLLLDKLGDGMFGSIYRGQTETGLKEPIAIKLLYDNNAIRPRQISELNIDELEAIIDPLASDHGKDPTKIKATIIQHRNSGFWLWKELEKAYGDEDESTSPPQSSEELDFESFMETITIQVSSSAVYRFHQEISVTQRLIQSSLLRFGTGDTKGIVRVRGGTVDFLSVLNASEELKNYFDQIEHIKISNYALVMDLYSFSLKDLLERYAIEGDKRTGYDVLKTLPHKKRIREALIILKGVADGLEKLHNVKVSKEKQVFLSLFHRDIKPANIFIKRISTDKFEVDLGDLGNLPYIPGSAPSDGSENSLLPSLNYDFAPGTQNYRSPEQKYYMDVADVQVIVLPERNLEDEVKKILQEEINVGGELRDEDGSDRLRSELISNDRPKLQNSSSSDSSHEPDQRAVLIVRDPKFRNTLIEIDDFVIFSKDTERKHHSISQCIPLGEDRRKNESGFWGFVLDVDLNEVNIKIDRKTQVEFYKTQRFRTDLFGIGAVMFDMITVGASPEQFYESIRKSEGQSINTIVNRYDTLTRGELEGENPDFIEIFRPFLNHNNPLNLYPDKEIIEFILKCMLYQSEGTFYQGNADEPRKASKALRTKMEDLRVKYTQDYRGLPEGKSILIHRPKLVDDEPHGLSDPFNQRIDKLQSLVEWSEYEQLDTSLMVANRLLYGAYYYWQVVDLVRDAIPVDNQFNRERMEEEDEQVQNADSLHLLQILPTFISLQLPNVERNIRAQLTLTALSIDLLKELRENQLELLIRSASNSFVPNEIASMRRDIRLLRLQPTETADGGKITCKYRFRDSAIISRAISEDDWIIIGSQSWKVVSVSTENVLDIELIEYKEGKIFIAEIFKDGEKDVDATYFSKIDPLKYYLEMLGLYLQQLIFTYSPITTTTRDRVDIRTLLRMFEIGPQFNLRDIKNSEWQSANDLEDIHEKFVYMYMNLTLHEAEGSYYNKISKSGTKTVFDMVQSHARDLYLEIRTLLGLDNYAPKDHPILIKSPEKFPDDFEKVIDNLMKDPIDIEKKIKRSGLIEGEDISVSR